MEAVQSVTQELGITICESNVEPDGATVGTMDVFGVVLLAWLWEHIWACHWFQ